MFSNIADFSQLSLSPGQNDRNIQDVKMPAATNGVNDGTQLREQLLNVISDVKARFGSFIDFPIPQFILIGKQSVGKSRLIESLAGEAFNFCSGTLGSRRPTVLEFRNAPELQQSEWYIMEPGLRQWQKQSLAQVVRVLNDAHEKLGHSVSNEPVYVRVKSRDSVDIQVVDLPGFREFAMDPQHRKLAEDIEQLVLRYMEDKRNVMLCVEECGDAANLATLSRCKRIDPDFKRTILIRNKLDKYYRDLTSTNVNDWLNGFGDLPAHLTKFALSLPHWKDGEVAPASFVEMRKQCSDSDISHLASLGTTSKFIATAGFVNFSTFMEQKVEKMFAESIQPVLNKLEVMQKDTVKRRNVLQTELDNTNPGLLLHTVRDAAMSFASAVKYVMEGFLSSRKRRVNLETELTEFHEYHKMRGTDKFDLLPSDEFQDLSDYLEFLRDDCRIAAFGAEINGGAQFQRLKLEVEIYFRFAEVCGAIEARDVIQARGISVGQVTWADAVTKLLAKEGHAMTQRKINYVGERIRWFFETQKEVILEFMDEVCGAPDES